jgi:hypothetical protein
MPRRRSAPPPRAPLATKRERVLDYAVRHPRATQKEVALACDCSLGYVHGLLRWRRQRQEPASTIMQRISGRTHGKKNFSSTGPNHDLQRRRRVLGKQAPLTQDEVARLVSESGVEVTRLAPGTHYGWRPSWA